MNSARVQALQRSPHAAGILNAVMMPVGRPSAPSAGGRLFLIRSFPVIGALVLMARDPPHRAGAATRLGLELNAPKEVEPFAVYYIGLGIRLDR